MNKTRGLNLCGLHGERPGTLQTTKSSRGCSVDFDVLKLATKVQLVKASHSDYNFFCELSSGFFVVVTGKAISDAIIPSMLSAPAANSVMTSDDGTTIATTCSPLSTGTISTGIEPMLPILTAALGSFGRVSINDFIFQQFFNIYTFS